MTIYQRMSSVFEHADLPGFLQEWRATNEYPVIPDMFATYQVTQSGSAMTADDIEIIHRYEVWIDLYGETDVSGALATVMTELEAQGFTINDVRDLDNTKATRYIYHRRWRVEYFDYCMDAVE